MHEKIRVAYKSMLHNMPYLFTYADLPQQNIPTTTNRLEGFFSHLKEKVKIHRGLSKDRKKNAIKFILNHGDKAPK